MSEIRIGVIGVGIIGKNHIDEYTNIPGAKVVAVADIDEAEARRVADRYGIPQVYTDFRRLLEQGDIDAVDVCLHNNFHAPVTIEALKAGKDVYCEKPIAGSFADGRAMVETAKSLGRKLHIQLANIYSRETKAAKTIIDEGGLGSIYHARSVGFRRRGRPFVDGYATPAFVKKEVAGGGALFDMGVYHISEILYLIGAPRVERISGKVYQETPIDERRRVESGYNVEELGLGFVRFEGGITLDVIEAWAMHLDRLDGSVVLGSQGGIRLRPFSFHTTSWDMELDAQINLDAMEYRRNQLYDNADAYRSSQRHWIAALQGRVDLLPTAELALKTMLIQEGIYLSDKLGREVSAEEVESGSQSTAVQV